MRSDDYILTLIACSSSRERECRPNTKIWREEDREGCWEMRTMMVVVESARRNGR